MTYALIFTRLYPIEGLSTHGLNLKKSSVVHTSKEVKTLIDDDGMLPLVD